MVDYVDEPTVSIRGSEEFAVHPGQQAAWLYAVKQGRPLTLVENAMGRGVRAALLAATSDRFSSVPTTGASFV